MALTIQRLNFDPVTGDNPSEAFMKIDLDIGEIAAVLNANPDIDDGLGDAATKNVGTGPGTVAAGDDARFLYRGRRNLLMNGNLRVNQRVFAGGAMSANTYGYDRWRTFGTASSFAVSGDLSTITLNGTIGQVIEAPALGGATVTVSVSNPSGPITVNLRPDATTVGVSGVVPAGVGIQAITLVVPSSLTGNVFVQLTSAAPTSIDGPAKRGGIQIELGSFASAFETVSFGEALRACQRFYEKSFNYATAPANQVAGAFYTGAAYTSTAVRVGIIPFKVAKRAVPNAVLYSSNVAAGAPAGSWSIFYSTGAWAASNTSGIASLSEIGMSVDLNFSGGLAWGQALTTTGNWAVDSDF